jgi:CDP-glycerol glycerophosphotransferase
MTADMPKMVTRTKPAAQARQYVRVRNRTSVDQRIALFEALDGAAYAGSPRAIYRAFLGSARFADHTFIWALDPPIAAALAASGYDVEGLEATEVSADGIDLDTVFGSESLAELRRATIVVRGTDAYLRAYARAGYWVTDSLLPHYLVPRKCQVMVQTWRGTPVNRIECDSPAEDGSSSHDRLEFEGRRLTYLVSPSQFASETFIGAFCLGRTKRTSAILQTGSPGTDSLITASAQEIAAIRERLSLPLGKQVVLWAPSAKASAPLDLEMMREALADQYVLLAREAGCVTDGHFARDVTGVSDINDLFLVSDVLVTDNSSAVVDYANLHRPIVRYVGAAQHDVAPGCELNLDPLELPGGSVSTTRELIDALHDVGPVPPDPQLHADFSRRFSPLADGSAAQRTLDRIAFDDPRIVAPRSLAQRTRSRLRTGIRKLKRSVLSASKRNSALRALSRTSLRIKRTLNYRKHCNASPVNSKMMIFESFVGWKYSCNPRALYEAVLRDPAFDDFTLVWAFKSPGDYRDVPDLGRATLVRYGSQAYYAHHAQARYWVSNSVVFPHMKLRDGQVYVQTWHGTPLKRLGCDIEVKLKDGVKIDAEEKRSWYEAEGRRFTFLLAQSPFAARALESAFDLKGSGRADAVLQEGYPRNDFLLNYTDEDAARIRRELDLPDDKTIVLYAPTWRDDQHQAGVGYTLDLGADFDALKRELGDTHVILFRAHYLIANSFKFERYGGFVRDVSQIDDINELYVASDLLITDYSSVFFDYANLRRPILFYMYDLQSYAEQIRGFYLDLSELPGPIVEHQEDLISAILASKSPDDEALRRLNGFADRFTSLDDGHASERVLAHMLASPGHEGPR